MSSWKELLTLYLRPAREYQELFLQTFFFFFVWEKILWQPGRNGKKILFSTAN
uniref:SLC38A2 protein n=1 Tax=Homo sapiens TaxID=9606 RepID=Q8NHT5_HUMAN|nr:SLC38A2 protein [Homo sapiens]